MYDGSGNIVQYVNADHGKTLMHRDYGPFGNFVGGDDGGKIFDELPFMFSTKYMDVETGYCYYGFRYYNPETGRWLNRDPIAEKGGPNLFGFVGNNPIHDIDILGKDWRKWFPFLTTFFSGGCKKAVKKIEDPNYKLKEAIEHYIDAVAKGENYDLPCTSEAQFIIDYSKWKGCRSDDGKGGSECLVLCACWFGHVDSRIVFDECMVTCTASYHKRCVSKGK